MRKLNHQELIDILVGATIFGTGGGGSLENGIRKVEYALDMGKEFNLNKNRKDAPRRRTG